jgi:hypothetical protein
MRDNDERYDYQAQYARERAETDAHREQVEREHRAFAETIRAEKELRKYADSGTYKGGLPTAGDVVGSLIAFAVTGVLQIVLAVVGLALIGLVADLISSNRLGIISTYLIVVAFFSALMALNPERKARVLGAGCSVLFFGVLPLPLVIISWALHWTNPEITNTLPIVAVSMIGLSILVFILDSRLSKAAGETAPGS